MSYLDQGYNKFLTKEEVDENKQEQTDLEFDQNIGKFSGSKIDENSLPGSAIMDGTMTNKDFAPSNRTVTAIVSQEADADFGDIQKAIDFVNAQGGGRILVLPGVYTVTQNITLYSDITIEGVSTADCIIDFNSTSFNLSASSPSDIKISRLTFKNCFNSTTGTIYLDQPLRAEISNCIFSDNQTGGIGCDIYVIRPRFVKVTFNITSTCGTFYYSDNASRTNDISFNDIQSPQNYVFYAGTTGNGGGATSYTNNNIASPKKTAVYGRFVTAVIQGNIFSAGGSSLTEVLFDVSNADALRIMGNFFQVGSSSAQAAINLTSSTNVNFVSNYIQGAKASTPVITLTSCNPIFFNGNILQVEPGVAGADIIKLASSSNIVITGNRIIASSSGTAYGVNMPSGSDFNVVVGNAITAATADTIDGGTGNVVASNS